MNTVNIDAIINCFDEERTIFTAESIKYKETIAQLEAQIKDLTLTRSANPFADSAKDETIKQVAELQQQLEAAKAELATSEGKRKSLWKRIDDHEKQITHLKAIHQGKVNEILKERESLAQKHATEIASLKSQLQNEVTAHTTEKAKVIEWFKAHTEIKQTVAAKDQEIATLKAKVAEVSNIARDWDKAYKELKQAVAAKDQEIATLKAQSGNTNNTHSALNSFQYIQKLFESPPRTSFDENIFTAEKGMVNLKENVTLKHAVDKYRSLFRLAPYKVIYNNKIDKRVEIYALNEHGKYVLQRWYVGPRSVGKILYAITKDPPAKGGSNDVKLVEDLLNGTFTGCVANSYLIHI